MSLKFIQMKRLAQFRTSAHRYNIETGRYGMKRDNILNRICRHCSNEDDVTLQLLSELPFYQPILEDENHVLNICPMYNEGRVKAKNIQSFLLSGQISSIFSNPLLTRELAQYLVTCQKKRFPKKVNPTSITPARTQ